MGNSLQTSRVRLFPNQSLFNSSWKFFIARPESFVLYYAHYLYLLFIEREGEHDSEGQLQCLCKD